MHRATRRSSCRTSASGAVNDDVVAVVGQETRHTTDRIHYLLWNASLGKPPPKGVDPFTSPKATGRPSVGRTVGARDVDSDTKVGMLVDYLHETQTRPTDAMGRATDGQTPIMERVAANAGVHYKTAYNAVKSVKGKNWHRKRKGRCGVKRWEKQRDRTWQDGISEALCAALDVDNLLTYRELASEITKKGIEVRYGNKLC